MISLVDDRVPVERRRRRQREGSSARRIECRLNVVAQAPGSSLVAVGGTVAMCAVRFVPRRTEVIECEVESATTAEAIDAETVRRAVVPAVILERLPKVTVHLKLLLYGGDGAEIAACVMAASLALADAKVECFGLVAAVGVGFVDQQVLVDPLPSEAVAPDLVVAAVGDQTTTVLYNGRADLRAMLRGAKDPLSQVHADMVTALRLHLEKQQQQQERTTTRRDLDDIIFPKSAVQQQAS